MDQQQLFETDPAPWVLDAQSDWIAAEVVFADAPYGPYWYAAGSDLIDRLNSGTQVQVPFGAGNRIKNGYFIRLIRPGDDPTNQIKFDKLKPIRQIADHQVEIPDNLIWLSQKISQYYLCPLGATIETVLPPGVRGKSGTRTVRFYSLAEDYSTRAAETRISQKQQSVIDVLKSASNPMTLADLTAAAQCTQSPINTLKKKGLIAVTADRVFQHRFDRHDRPPANRHIPVVLNDEQIAALKKVTAQIEQHSYASMLLFGVTGSGKTEVYIRAIQKVIEFGRQAIVLVPEISLTPQTERRFRERFDSVAVLHSHQSPIERSWHWRQIVAGKVQVVVGARSAVFAPVPHLGLIVLDEEHDASFKQDTRPRYHARQVAAWRAQREQVPLVLGSATPSLESWHQVQIKSSQLIRLTHRVQKLILPHVSTVDLRNEGRSPAHRGAISRELHREIQKSLDDGGQIILLLNRRGFATSVQCPHCGTVMRCQDCAIPMTHHRDGARMICHYCDHQSPAPHECAKCGSSGIRFSGIGTQRLEEEIRRRFPKAACVRMDTDTMRRPGSHQRALDDFRNGKSRILLGTQMIAKGLDFPNVTLVGVINADTAMHLPDFRASERTFSLVTQVAGRTGRGERGGHVIVQTYSPDHPAIRAAVKHDFEQFADYELAQRQPLSYPPWGKMARIIVRSPDLESARAFIEQIGELLESRIAIDELPIRVIGPTTAPIEKLRGKYRFHLMLLTDLNHEFQPLVSHVIDSVKQPNDVQLAIDIDPFDMM